METGDTTGMANPVSAYAVASLVKQRLRQASLAVHFHQAGGIEFANVLASLEAGVTVLDSAAGGLGGCPYAPGALGNIATETLVEAAGAVAQFARRIARDQVVGALLVVGTGVKHPRLHRAIIFKHRWNCYHFAFF